MKDSVLQQDWRRSYDKFCRGNPRGCPATWA